MSEATAVVNGPSPATVVEGAGQATPAAQEWVPAGSKTEISAGDIDAALGKGVDPTVQAGRRELLKRKARVLAAALLLSVAGRSDTSATQMTNAANAAKPAEVGTALTVSSWSDAMAGDSHGDVATEPQAFTSAPANLDPITVRTAGVSDGVATEPAPVEATAEPAADTVVDQAAAPQVDAGVEPTHIDAGAEQTGMSAIVIDAPGAEPRDSGIEITDAVTTTPANVDNTSADVDTGYDGQLVQPEANQFVQADQIDNIDAHVTPYPVVMVRDKDGTEHSERVVLVGKLKEMPKRQSEGGMITAPGAEPLAPPQRPNITGTPAEPLVAPPTGDIITDPAAEPLVLTNA